MEVGTVSKLGHFLICVREYLVNVICGSQPALSIRLGPNTKALGINVPEKTVRMRPVYPVEYELTAQDLSRIPEGQLYPGSVAFALGQGLRPDHKRSHII